MGMPRRKGIFFEAKDVARVRLIKPVRTGPSLTRGRMFYGKIYLKPQNFPNAKASAQRVFLKPAGRNVHEELALRNRLRAIGLPVPKAGTVTIQTKEGPQEFLAIEAFLRRGGTRSKLKPINPPTYVKNTHGTRGELVPNPKPGFLKKISLTRNRKLIEQIAQDMAAMIVGGINVKVLDHYGFYRRKDGTWQRIIMDTDSLYAIPTENPSDFRQHQQSAIRLLLGKISLVWQGNTPRFKVFKKAFLEALPRYLKNEQIDFSL